MGFTIRLIHLNFASFLFVLIYSHIGRGLYYSSYRLPIVWNTGMGIILIMMLTAFMGYVLPWGQISFWGGTVITSLLRVIPVFGSQLITWLWAGYILCGATLSLFFLLHYLVPLLIIVGLIRHLLFLHYRRSTNPILIHERLNKIDFNPFFTLKDSLNFTILAGMGGSAFVLSWCQGDPENWLKATSLFSPRNILPEWYFMFAYAILRAFPNKIGGILMFLIRVLIFFPLALYQQKRRPKTTNIKLFSILIIITFRRLTILGAEHVTRPFIEARQLFSGVYFLSVLLITL